MNGLELDPIPLELLDLNPMEVRLVSQGHVYIFILHLPYCQLGARGTAIAFSVDTGELVQQLPRLRGDAGVVMVRVPGARRPDPGRRPGGGGDAGAEGEGEGGGGQGGGRRRQTRGC